MAEPIVLNQFEMPVGELGNSLSVRLSDMKPDDATLRTHNVGPNAIESTETPAYQDQIDKKRITPPLPQATAVEEAAASAGVAKKLSFPNFAFAVIKLSIAREAYGSDKLKLLSQKVKEQLGDIDLLLELTSELTSLPDKDSHDVTPKMKTLIGKLEVHKIQVWNESGKLTKEKLLELKAQISSQIDKLRTSIQTTISTEIQPEANSLQAIMNTTQQIIQSDSRLKRKTTEVPR